MICPIDSAMPRYQLPLILAWIPWNSWTLMLNLLGNLTFDPAHPDSMNFVLLFEEVLKTFNNSWFLLMKQLFVDKCLQLSKRVSLLQTKHWHAFVGLFNSFCLCGQLAAYKLSLSCPFLHLIGIFYEISLVLFPRENGMLKTGKLPHHELQSVLI